MEPAFKAKIWDLLLPAAVVATVGMMVFPVPLWMLDFLLMCNITFALSLLITSVYLSEPERFTALPSILLLATLFRLGLNISTTSQILAIGDAPATVMTFGQFVVQGSLVVGIVVFLIITLVQFLVVAKGAERVAEVAARFSLDGMPGKQMSIDADVRTGLLGLVEAREKRMDLQRESRLYGSLDGAMKFVKGDAIAGVLITILNISAGLILGVTRHGLDIAQAVEKFTLFTIGDGLVSQIPALLVAVAAGIAVTRVRDVLKQLTQEPQAVGITAVVLAALGAVPGFPAIAFWPMSFCLFLCARYLKRSRAVEEQRLLQTEFRPALLSQLILRLSPVATRRLQQEQQLPALVQSLRNEVFADRGLIAPELQFDVIENEEDLYVELLFEGVPFCSIDANAVSTSAQELLSEEIVHRLRHFFYDRSVDLIDDTQTRMLLEVHRPTCEDLINSVVPEALAVTQLTTLLRQLVREGVGVRALHTILQSVAEHSLAKSEHSWELLARVRVGLKKTITRSLPLQDGLVAGWVLSARLSAFFAQHQLADMPVDAHLVGNLVEEIRTRRIEDEPLVLFTSSNAREIVSTSLRNEKLALSVIASEEIDPTVEIRILGEIGNELLPKESAVDGLSAPSDLVSRMHPQSSSRGATGTKSTLRAVAH